MKVIVEKNTRKFLHRNVDVRSDRRPENGDTLLNDVLEGFYGKLEYTEEGAARMGDLLEGMGFENVTITMYEPGYK